MWLVYHQFESQFGELIFEFGILGLCLSAVFTFLSFRKFPIGIPGALVIFYFLSFPNTPAIPHQDNVDFNCLIYLLGNPLINNGTGFYIEQEGNQVLNSHVGFKENRAIFFDAKIYHSPLQFAGNSTPRYVMANFIKTK